MLCLVKVSNGVGLRALRGLVSNSLSSSETRACLKSNWRFGLDGSSLRVCFGQMENEWPVPAARWCMCPLQFGLSCLLGPRVSDTDLGLSGRTASAGIPRRLLVGKLVDCRTREAEEH